MTFTEMKVILEIYVCITPSSSDFQMAARSNSLKIRFNDGLRKILAVY